MTEWAIKATKEVTRLSLKEWNHIYEVLSEELNEPQLANELVAAANDSRTVGATHPSQVPNSSSPRGVESKGTGALSSEEDTSPGGSRSPCRSCWTLSWAQLTNDQKAATEYLGWTAESWNDTPYYWPFPRGITWWDMPEKIRSSLEVLGESAESWAAWGRR